MPASFPAFFYSFVTVSGVYVFVVQVLYMTLRTGIGVCVCVFPSIKLQVVKKA